LAQQGVAARIKYSCRLSMDYKVEKQSQDLHDYALHTRFENVSAKPVNDWHVDVEIPTPLLKNAVSHLGHVCERSNDKVTLIRFTHESHKGVVYTGNSKLLKISYRMNQTLFDYRSRLFEQVISARAYADEVAAEEIRKTVREMQLPR
jgi:hypothetical protein